MSSLKDELRGIDKLSDSLRDIERELFLQAQISQQIEASIKEHSAKKKSLSHSIEAYKSKKTSILQSIEEKENILQSNKLLNKVALGEIQRLKTLLHEKARAKSSFLLNLQDNLLKMEEIVVATFGADALEGHHIRVKKLRVNIQGAKTTLNMKEKELLSLQSTFEDMDTEAELKREEIQLEKDLIQLFDERTHLENKIKELNRSSTPKKKLDLSVSLEASAYMKYPKLIDGSSFFKNCFDRVKSSSRVNLSKPQSSIPMINRDGKGTPNERTPENKTLTIGSKTQTSLINEFDKEVVSTMERINTIESMKSTSPSRKASPKRDSAKSPYFSSKTSLPRKVPLITFGPTEDKRQENESKEAQGKCDQENSNEDISMPSYRREKENDDNNLDESVAMIDLESCQGEDREEEDESDASKHHQNNMVFNFDCEKEDDDKMLWKDESSKKSSKANLWGSDSPFLFGGSSSGGSGAGHTFFSANDQDEDLFSANSFFK